MQIFISFAAMRILIAAIFFFGFLSSVQGIPQDTIKIEFSGSNYDAQIELTIHSSLRQIIEFSQVNTLGILSPQAFVKRAVIYSTKAKFDDMIRNSPGWPREVPVPPNYAGVGHDKTFHVVSWEAYQTIYPRENYEDYQKLITHELAHLFHVSYLNGQEDKMGPIWFYEGLPCLIANQYPDAILPENEDLREILKNPERGNYKTYVAILRALIKKKPLRDLLNEASQDNFSESVAKLLEK